MLQLDTLPPTATRGFAPEEKQFLRHAHGVAVGRFAADVRAQAREGDGADDRFVGFGGAVAPDVGVVEAADSNQY